MEAFGRQDLSWSDLLKNRPIPDDDDDDNDDDNDDDDRYIDSDSLSRLPPFADVQRSEAHRPHPFCFRPPTYLAANLSRGCRKWRGAA